MENIKKIHVGNMIRNFIEKNMIVRTYAGKKMGLPNTVFYAYEKRESLQISNLLRICHGFHYNFFMDIANNLPESYGYDKSLSTSKDAVIAQQAEEIKKLKFENDLLKELISKKG